MRRVMISRTSKYALRVLGYLIAQGETRTTGEELARNTGIPANYLSKVLSQLRKHGFVDAEKGWGGGFRVRRQAMDRPIKEILEIIDGPERTESRECVFGLPECDEEHPCPLHDRWGDIRKAYLEMLTATKVADLEAR
ncbi:MAG: Rrf2 family transcriptional regulator [Candidatus Eisenbacteria bacterium]|nr:Rrf2 family transcriptional regulator [Candidatus Latescibacterota bacterium]MBD3301141.1 Rrf2 family transcriptional regulator [Candidatus Eisenbacteria bacterium]